MYLALNLYELYVYKDVGGLGSYLPVKLFHCTEYVSSIYVYNRSL